MIKEEKWNQFGFPRSEADIQGITLHETGNTEMSAEDLFNWLNDESKTSQGCHYLVDDKQVIEVMPNDWAVYHTGKGKDWGCRYTIAIEIVSNLNDGLFNEAVNRAVSLVYSLQKKYKIPMNNIFFHNDFNDRTYCPKTLLDQYGCSQAFAYERLGE